MKARDAVETRDEQITIVNANWKEYRNSLEAKKRRASECCDINDRFLNEWNSANIFLVRSPQASHKSVQ